MSRHSIAPERVASRVSRLKSELEQELVPILDSGYFPEPLKAAWPATFDVLCEELTFARYVQIHEGYRPSYGCFIVDDLSRVPGSAGVGASVEHEQGHPQVDDLRLVVDGEHTFLIRDLHGGVSVAPLSAAEQLDPLGSHAGDVGGLCPATTRRSDTDPYGLDCVHQRWL